MDIESLVTYCEGKAGVEACFPFDKDTLVFKVMGKMFILVGLEKIPLSINLKCDPERSIELREKYIEVQPGYHMNKKLWNTINIEGSLSIDLIRELIDHSYDLVVASLPKHMQLTLKGIE